MPSIFLNKLTWIPILRLTQKVQVINTGPSALQACKVVAVGHGTKDDPMVLKEGDTVLYGKYAGTELENEGEKYLMMRQSDVLAVVED